MTAQVVRLRDFRSRRDEKSLVVAVKAPYPVQIMWHSGMLFFAGMGVGMIFAGWLTSEIARGCFMAAGYCDDRGKR